MTSNHNKFGKERELLDYYNNKRYDNLYNSFSSSDFVSGLFCLHSSIKEELVCSTLTSGFPGLAFISIKSHAKPKCINVMSDVYTNCSNISALAFSLDGKNVISSSELGDIKLIVRFSLVDFFNHLNFLYILLLGILGCW